MRVLRLALLASLLLATPAAAATVTVCASGCTNTNAQLQTAIDAASAGDVILLQEGFEYVGDYTLPVKSGSGPSAWVEIRTGVNSTGTIQATSRYPAENVRVCPATFNVDTTNCALLGNHDVAGRYAKIKPSSNNECLRTTNTGSGTPVSYYRVKWIEFVANTFAGNALICLTNETVPATTGSSAMLPHHFEFIAVVVRGQASTGQKRGWQIDANAVTIRDSFAYDIKSTAEGQVVWANSSVGPLLIENCYFSGGTEVFMTGGGGTTPHAQFTVSASPTPTTTDFAVSATTDLYTTKTIAVRVHGIGVTSSSVANPTVITTSAAHGYTAGEQVVIVGHSGYVDSGGTNVSVSPTRILQVLSSTTFSIARNFTTGGTGGTVYVRASTDITNIAGSTLTVSPALPHAPVSGDLVESSLVIQDVTVRKSVFTRPSSYRTVETSWLEKNVFEFKQVKGFLLEYNIFENSWPDGQNGPCILFTATQQGVEADSAVVRDGVFRYNVVRNCVQGLQFSGRDANNDESGRNGNVDIVHNLWYNIGTPYGTYTAIALGGTGGGERQHPTRAPYDLTFDHNTIHSPSNSMARGILFDYCDPLDSTAPSLESTSENTLVTNNIIYWGTGGALMSVGTTQANCGDGLTGGRVGSPPLGSGSLISTNALVGGTSNAAYIANTTASTYPSEATMEADTFTNTTTVAGFKVKATSTYFAGAADDALDGLSLGPAIAEFEDEIAIAESGNNVPATGGRIRIRIRTEAEALLDATLDHLRYCHGAEGVLVPMSAHYRRLADRAEKCEHATAVLATWQTDKPEPAQ